ncbi:MAG: hypothetical protein MAGBODY4_00557 [Candidatus Marinimicrobia bacterium]|nr:hypothetical protein [Candidatus Neomarinimicrobiota bacterium]
MQQVLQLVRCRHHRIQEIAGLQTRIGIYIKNITEVSEPFLLISRVKIPGDVASPILRIIIVPNIDQKDKHLAVIINIGRLPEQINLRLKNPLVRIHRTGRRLLQHGFSQVFHRLIGHSVGVPLIRLHVDDNFETGIDFGKFNTIDKTVGLIRHVFPDGKGRVRIDSRLLQGLCKRRIGHRSACRRIPAEPFLIILSQSHL